MATQGLKSLNLDQRIRRRGKNSHQKKCRPKKRPFWSTPRRLLPSRNRPLTLDYGHRSKLGTWQTQKHGSSRALSLHVAAWNGLSGRSKNPSIAAVLALKRDVMLGVVGRIRKSESEG